MNIESVGQKVGEIPVEIRYRIIELFSAGLYSSPNKAFEELVSNSYDALAKKVCVYVPLDTTTANARIWVCDNGISMDSDGLKLLWKIGSNHKREDFADFPRLQIGKFGIGKLATYVLARKLTHICKIQNRYLAVTMDYLRIDQYSEKTKEIILEERELKLDEVKSILKPLINEDGQYLLSFNLWGKSAEESWTFAIMSDLKPKAKEIREGRLKWVLRTALPLNPDFELYYNGAILESSKQEVPPIKTWIIGKDDQIAEKHEAYEITNFNSKPAINLKSLRNVHGEINLYRDSLVTGKSEKLGRSHGIFLMVRERLINTDDPLLGMDAFTHGVFNRTRMIIHADGLDEYITSTRESIKESQAFSQLQEYLKRKFNNEVRPYFFRIQEEEEKRKRASYKVQSTAASLSRRPLLVVARKYFKGEISNPVLIELPKELSSDEQANFLEKLEDDLTSEKGIIEDVLWEIMEPESPLAKFDLVSRVAKVNLMHPFFANFSEEVKSTLPFQLIAITEILTEAHLIELGIDEDIVRKIVMRRDQILRELTYSDRPNAPVVASMIKDSLADSTGLENAVYNAFNTLGFETIKIGGRGKPDGKAIAVLGYTGEKVKAEYSLVYDAKSSSKERIASATAKISTSVRHRKDYKANYSLVIAKDFEGADDSGSAISKESKQQKVNLIRAKDLCRLVLLSGSKQIGLSELKGLFETCHTVIETSAWIEKIRDKEVNKQPIKPMLETVFKLQKEDTEPPIIAAVRMAHDTLKRLSIEQIRTLIQSLQTLVPGFISLEGEIVSLQAKPEKILDVIHQVTTVDIPPEFREAYLKAFEQE
jgi:hypothetical protein